MPSNLDASTNWREAVRRVMYSVANEEAESHADGEVTFNYRWEHVRAVATLAVRLAELVEADAEVVEAAAWLHDARKETGEEHAAVGAAFARDFLATTDFPAQKIERVAQAIANHQGLWRDEPLNDLESAVLWDADKLSKLGLTAAFHFTGWTLNGRRDEDGPFSTRDLITRGADADWQDRTVASMHTAPARRAARTRLETYRRLWRDLAAELAGDDLPAA
ncbi:MAG: HD domain-containing protein [Candidatus Promineifilaceae bacterium]|nr:HD domain-containing protein [Candidatus Promineifilaceae bacterium]